MLHVQKYYDNWITVSQYIIDMNNVGISKNDIFSYLYSYLNKDMLYAQILFINIYIIDFYNKHFQWYKRNDEMTKRAGFIEIHMVEHYYIMSRNLSKLTNERKRESMSDFITRYQHNSSIMIDEFVVSFFRLEKVRMDKHINQRWTQHLLFDIADDPYPESYLCNWMLGRGGDGIT